MPDINILDEFKMVFQMGGGIPKAAVGKLLETALSLRKENAAMKARIKELEAALLKEADEENETAMRSLRGQKT